jgi:zinc D-Ala-D-Ala carboxypeptidase
VLQRKYLRNLRTMKISNHLSLSEVTRSETAKRKGISNTPTAEHLENFKILAENVFEKIRTHFGVPIHISSGYRSKELNDAIGGSQTSQHSKGQAIDIDMDGSSNGVSNADVYNFIKDNLEFDQLIWEFGTDKNPDWVHVSYVNGPNRKQKLKAVRTNGKTSYVNIP